MVTTLETAKIYLFNMWKNHRLPCSIVSNRELQFTSQVMKDLCKCLSISPKLSIMNQDLQQYLRLFTAENQDKWADWLPITWFSYNTEKQASTKKSPFKITQSYVPRIGIE